MVKPLTLITALILSTGQFGYSSEFPTPYNNKVKSMIKLNELVPEMPVGKFWGISVAIDGNVAAVGSEEGKEILVFEKIDNAWRLSAKLRTSNHDHLKNVAISGETIVVGGYGSIFIFTKPIDGWADTTETAILKNLNPDVFDQLGNFIVIEGDVILAAVRYFNSYFGLNLYQDTNARVLVYQKPETGWTNMTETAELTVTDQSDTVLETFGYALAVQDDFIFVGAPAEDRLLNGGADRLTNTGAVYVYQRTGNTWQNMTETRKIAYEAPTSKDMFGGIIDINNDTMIIGTYPHDEHLNR